MAAAPRIDLLYAYDARGEEERLMREANEILDQFRHEPEAILQLGNFATDTGRTTLSRQVYELALESGFEVAPFSLLYVESHVVSGKFTEAVAFCDELAREDPSWMSRNQNIFNSLRSIAYFGLGNDELGQLYLEKFLEDAHIRSETFLSVANRFRKIGHPIPARTLLLEAYRRDPKNQLALSGVIEVDLETGNSRDLTSLLRELLRLRRPLPARAQ